MPDMVSVRRPPSNQFAQEPGIKIGRSQFDRSHGMKTAFDASYLYPIFVDDVLPGDTFTMKLNGFARIFSPLDAPIMDNIELETFFFFVPNRLVWSNWAYFNGEHDEAGIQDTDYTIPILEGGAGVTHNVGQFNGYGLAAYMGLPHNLTPDDTEVSALPFRGYNLIYNEWFRSQNLINEVDNIVGNGPDDLLTFYDLLKSAKKHDYFTSCLPYVQKGDAVDIALSGFPEVTTSQAEGSNVGLLATAVSGYRELDSGAAQVDVSASVASGAQVMFVDLSTIAGMNVNTLRESVAIQRLLERDARGGTRYVEIIKSHFGVTSPDFRLQRPEYLGGGKSYINVSPVANTRGVDSADSISGNDEPQGELRGVGTGSINGHGWAKSFTEHGYVIGLIRARGDITYFQGLERHWSRSTRYDFYIPALANLGEQSILNKELYVTNVANTDNAVFGYQERWSEYRYKPSKITGVFNPDAAANLGFWHLAEDFAAAGPLNQAFIEDQTPMSRITTTTAQPDFLLDMWFDYKCARPIPVHSIPSLIGTNF